MKKCENCGHEYCPCEECERIKRGLRVCWNCLYNALHKQVAAK